MSIIRRFTALFRQSQLDRDLHDEMQFHLEMRASKNIETGMSPQEAQATAVRQFGNRTIMKESARSADSLISLESLLRDVRFGLRMLLKSPGFAAVAILTIALGIGANTAIFSVINEVLLARLPYRNPNQIVCIQAPTKNNHGFSFSAPDYADYRQSQRTFTGISLWTGQSMNLTGQERPDRITGSFVSANFFDMLGVQIAAGRTFQAGEDKPGAPGVVILTDRIWQARFAANPQIIGQSLILNNEPYTVVGILPPNFNFFGFADNDVYVTFPHYPNFRDTREAKNLLMIGRIQDGVTSKTATADLEVIARRLAHDYPETNPAARIVLTPVRELSIEEIRPALLVLMGAVGLVLLIACANLANLMLARGTTRLREMAVRSALGASRFRILRQLLVESLVIALLGGATGIVLGFYGLKLLLAWNPNAVPTEAQPGLAWPVLFFALALSLITGLFFGLMPALQLSRSTAASLSTGTRTTTSRSHTWIRSAFVVAQVSLSIVLLVGAGLFVRTFKSLLDVNPGFRTENLLTMEYRLPKTKYISQEAQRAFHKQMLERVKQVPGVQSAAIVQALPFSGNRGGTQAWPADKPLPDKNDIPIIQTNVATPEFFDTIGINILQGRGFTDHDTATSPLVILISQTAANTFWPNEVPIGKRLRFSGQTVSTGSSDGPTEAIVIGVVPTIKQSQMRDRDAVQVYFPYSQQGGIFGTLAVRTAADPLNFADAVRNAVWSIDKDQPVWKIRTMDNLIQMDVAQDRFLMTLMTCFGMLALALTALGAYGVISYGVSQRTQEFGVRMALGATPHRIMHLVLNRGLGLVLIGSIVGVAAALACSRFMSTLLFGVKANDPSTFAIVMCIMAAVATLSSYLPARRATKVDPMTALRID